MKLMKENSNLNHEKKRNIKGSGNFNKPWKKN